MAPGALGNEMISSTLKPARIKERRITEASILIAPYCSALAVGTMRLSVLNLQDFREVVARPGAEVRPDRSFIDSPDCLRFMGRRKSEACSPPGG